MTHDSVVYYIGARQVRRVKIGVTTDLRARLHKLRAQSIDALEVLAMEWGGHGEERLRHEVFSDMRRHGEWFEWTEEIDHWISIVRSPWVLSERWLRPWPGLDHCFCEMLHVHQQFYPRVRGFMECQIDAWQRRLEMEGAAA